MGGVYVDTSMTLFVPFKEILKASDKFVSAEDIGVGRISNAFIASVPDNPLLLAVIETIVKITQEQAYGVDPLDITGPTMLARVFEEYVGQRPRPNTTYLRDGSVRLLSHIASEPGVECSSTGLILDGDRKIFTTKYPTYRAEMKHYSNKAYYSTLWHIRRVYKN